MYLNDTFTTPPRVTMTGIARSTYTEIVIDPSTGESTVVESTLPVPGALVVLKEVRTGRIVGETSADETGLWRITNLESELEYDVFVIDVVDRTRYSVCQRVQVYDRDVIDSAVQALVESEGIVGKWADQHYDMKIVLPPMETRKDYDGRVYGLVKDAISKETLAGSLVEVYRGHLTADEVLREPGPAYTYYTSERGYVNKGFYEVYMPSGDYTVRVLKNGYVTSAAHPVTVGSGAELNVELHRCTVDGNVYDAYDHMAGILTPIPGATISFNGVTAESGNDGSYIITADVTPEQQYVVACEKKDYVAVKKTVYARSQSIRGVAFFLWPVSHYSHR